MCRSRSLLHHKLTNPYLVGTDTGDARVLSQSDVRVATRLELEDSGCDVNGGEPAAIERVRCRRSVHSHGVH